jgi:hypothetical protein
MNARVLLAALTIAGGSAPAAQGVRDALPAPDDFAFGFTVQPEGASAVWEVTVADDLYRSVYRADLGDVRVFDREGRVVPHSLRHATTMAARPAAQRLAVFPVHGSGVDAGRIRIVADEQKAVIETGSGGGSSGAAGAGRVVAYLIDLGGDRGPVDSVALDWVRARPGGFAATVDVAVSDELTTWRTVASAVTVADLESGTARLVHRTVDLPSVSGRYVRIAWPSSLQDVRLTGADVVFSPARRSVERRTRQLEGTVEEHEGVTGYAFDTGGHYPIDRVRIAFDERNRVLDGRLLSRAAPDGEWALRYTGTFYRLESNGVEVASDPEAIALTPDRYWRFEPAASAGALQPVRLEVGWVPHQLLFVSQGDPPFTVAFGSATIDRDAAAGESVRDAIDRASAAPGVDASRLVTPASASGILTLGGPSRLAPAPAPLPWRTWTLWAVLFAGVGVLAWMVWRLTRQMTSPPDR